MSGIHGDETPQTPQAPLGPDPDFDLDFGTDVGNSDYNSDLDEEMPLHPVSFPTYTTTQDLKSQLSQLQQKLNFGGSGSNELHDNNNNNNITVDDDASDMSFDISDLGGAFGVGGATGNDRALVQSTAPHSSLSYVQEPDRSVDFLGDLSDGLLMESRKLNYENKQFKRQIKQLLEDCENKNTEISNLSELNNKLCTKEEEQSEQLWKLESELRDFKSALDLTKTDLVKVQKDNAQSLLLVETLKNTIEELKSEKQQLVESSGKTITKLNSQIDELKESNDNLNEENDVLHKNILNLSETVDNLKHEIETKSATPTEDTSFSEVDDSILQDPLPAFLPKDFDQLDTESLQKNLKVSYQQLMKLKSQNVKMKTELLRLKHASPKGKKIRNLSNRENSILPESATQSSWANYNDDSFMKPSNINLTPGLDSIMSRDDNDNDNDNEDDDIDIDMDLDIGDEHDISFDPSQMDGSSPVKLRKLSMNLAKPSYMLIVPQTTLDTTGDKFDLQQLDFSKYRTIPVPSSLNDQLIDLAVKEDNAFTTADHLQLIPTKKIQEFSDEIEKLKTDIGQPSLDYISSKSKILNHTLLPTESHASLLSEIEEKKNQIAAFEKSHDANQKSIDVLKKELEVTSSAFEEMKSKIDELNSVIDSPTREYIVAKASSQSMITVETQKYQDILTRVEKLQHNINESDAHLKSLETTIDTLKSEKKALEEKVASPELDYLKKKADSVNHVIIPVTEHHALTSKIIKLKSGVDERDQKINMIMETNTELETKLDGLQKQFFDAKSKIGQLTSGIDTLTSEKKVLETNLKLPALDYLKEKATSSDHIMIPLSSHTEMVSNISSLETQLKEKDVKITSFTTELDSNQTVIDNLRQKIELNESEIAKLNAKITALNDHKKNLEDSINSPQLDYVKQKASDAGYVAVLQSTHDELTSKVPALESQLQDKVNEIAALNKNIDSSNLEVKKLMGQINFSDTQLVALNTAIDEMKNEKQSIEAKLQTPDLEYLQEKATLSRHVVIPEAEHIDLTSKIPVFESQIKEKNVKIAALMETIHSLESNLGKVEAEISSVKMSSEDLQLRLNELQQAYDSPDIQYINTKCTDLKIHPISVAEFTELNNDLASKRAKLSQLSEELCSIKSEKDEMLQLNEKAEEKIENLTKELEKLSAKHSNLSDKYESPGIDYIKSKAETHALTAIPLSEHASLKKNLEDKQTEIDHLSNLKEDLNSKHAEIETLLKTKLELDDRITDLSKNLVEREAELVSLKAQIESPSADYIYAKSVSHNLVALPIPELKSLKDDHESTKKELAESILQIKEKERELVSVEKLKDDLAKQLEINGTTTVSLNLHNSVQSELNQTRKELSEHQREIETLRHLEVELQSKKEDIVQMQTKIDDLREKENKLADLETEVAHLRTAQEELHEKRAELEQMNIDNDEMQKQIDSLKMKETALEDAILKIEEKDAHLKQLQSTHDNPEFNYLEGKLKSLGFVPISLKEHECSVQSLKDLEDNKLRLTAMEDELAEMANSKKEILDIKENLERELSDLRSELEREVSTSAELKSSIENPGSDYMKSKSSSLGLVTLPLTEHKSLIAKLNSLNDKSRTLEADISDLTEEKAELQKRIKELEALQDNPSKEYIQSKSASLGIIPIPIAEHQSKQSDIKRKDILIKQYEATIQDYKDLKCTLEAKTLELDDVQSKLKHSEQEHTAAIEKLESLSYIVDAKESEMKKMSKALEELTQKHQDHVQSFETLMKNVEEKDLELNKLDAQLSESLQKHEEVSQKMDHLRDSVSAKEVELDDTTTQFREMTQLYQSPALDYLKEKLIDHNHVAISNEDLDNLKKTKEMAISKSAELEKSIQETTSKIQVLEEERESDYAKLVEVEKKRDVSTTQISELEKRLEDSLVAFESLTAAKLELDGRLQEYERSNDETNKRAIDLEKRNNDLQAQCDKLSTTNAEIVAESKEVAQSREEVLTKQVELEKSVKDISVLLSQTEAEKKEACAKVAELEKDTAALQATISVKDQQLHENTTSLQNRINELDSELNEKSIAVAELESLKAELVTKKIELKNTMENLNELKMKYDSPTLEYLATKLTSLDRISLPIAEHKNMLTSKEDAVQLIDALRSKLDAAEENLDKKNAELDIALQQLKANKREQEEEVAILKSKSLSLDMQKSTSIATVTSDNIHDLANQSAEFLIPLLKEKGYSVLPNDEYERLLHTDLELDDIADITHEMEELEHDLESKRSILEDLDARSRSSLVSADDSMVSTVVPVETVLSEKAEALRNKIDEISSTLAALNDKKSVLIKQVSRLSVSSFDGTSKNLNGKLSNKLKKIENEIEIKEIELKSQQNALVAVEAYMNRAKDLTLPPVVKQVPNADHAHIADLETEIKNLEEKHESKKNEFESLRKELNKTSEPGLLAERLSMLGYHVEAPDGKELSLNYLRMSNKNVSHAALVKSKHFDATTGTYNLDSLFKDNDWMLLTSSKMKITQALDYIAHVSYDELKSKLNRSGYVLLKDPEYKDLVTKSNEPKLPAMMNESELQQYANKLHLQLISENELNKLKNHTISTRDLAQKSKELNLVLLSSEEVKKLRENAKLTAENISTNASALGLMCIPRKQYLATTVSKTPDIPNVIVLPNSYYKILTRSHDWYKKNKHSLTSPKTATIDENESFEIKSMSPSTFQQPRGPNQTHLPGTDVDRVSLKSVGTVITEKDVIIKAVMKTVIGEFLYKYYRKLGPFTSISDTRHQRYFWIHPYSMTLYWSTANPVFSDPAKNQIKAITILDVVSVEDNNPLPVGVYHKSLIIKSFNKNLKLTCPTRQIHNVWYNSLRYLLDKNPKQMINDDNVENQYEQDFTMDKKLEIERSQSQAIRQSRMGSSTMSARRSPSMMIPRAEPRSPGLYNRSTSTRSFSSLRGHPN